MLADRLACADDRLAAAAVVVGFDGFVDEMITPVLERADLHTFTAVPTISAFAGLVAAASGRSSCREIVIRETTAGGCAVNLGDGLAALGAAVHCFATLGRPVHPAFAVFANRMRECVSWGNEPGRTLAFEFGDGKLMYPAVAPLADFTPQHVQAQLADGRYAAACVQAATRNGAITFTNWSLYPHMTACWQVVQREVLAHLPRRPLIFIDLVDPSARSLTDMRAMGAGLAGFAAVGETVLGINLNEAAVLARAFALPAPDPADLPQAAEHLRRSLGIARVVLHTHHGAVEASASGTAAAPSFHTANPVRSVGAGDRFNAGYLAGCMLDFSPVERLRTAAAVAGAFVRLGRSPTVGEAAALLRDGAARIAAVQP